MEFFLDEGTKVYSDGLEHITKMADMPIYAENRLKYSPELKVQWP